MAVPGHAAVLLSPVPSQYYPVKPLLPVLFRRALGAPWLSIILPLPLSSSPLHFVYLFCTDVGLGLLSSHLLAGGLVADLLAPALPVWTGGPRALGELSSTIPLGRMGGRERWCCRGGPGGPFESPQLLL